MIEIKFHLAEFMDGDPVTGCPVVTTVQVVPRWIVLKPAIKLGDAPAPLTAAPADNSGPGQDDGVIPVLEPHFQFAMQLPPQRVDSGPDGVATFLFDADATFQQVATTVKGGETAFDVAAFARVEVDFAGLHRRINLLSFPLEASDRLEKSLVLDLAKAIVGHTDANSARLWFQKHGAVRSSHRYVCEIRRADAPPNQDPLQAHDIAFDPAGGLPHTASLQLTDLDPGTRYRYRLRLFELQGGFLRSEQLLIQGAFATRSAGDDGKLEFIFGSCHQPSSSRDIPTEGEALNRWQALANRDDYELLILMGDQIYGDGIERHWPDEPTWFQRYVNRYNQLWSYWPMRQVLRRTPTYMALDDHEAVDDWGTVPVQELNGGQARIDDALAAYRRFQHPHNPSPPDGPLHYHFRRGPAAFFVMDSRSRRGQENQFPIMGQRQFQDFRRWADSAEAREADVIIFVSPVPIAFVPADTIIDMVAALEPLVVAGAAKVGTVIGAGAGWLIGGPAGAAIGAPIGGYLGGIGAQYAYDEFEEDLPTDLDLADQWTIEENQVELERVLEVLHDLANDVQNGGPGPRPRAVFVLGGDAHSGWMHLVRSRRDGSGHDHRRNPFTFHLLSSSISRKPVVEGQAADLVRAVVGEPKDISQADLIDQGFSANMNSRPTKFVLDGERAGHYAAETLGAVIDRTFGRFKMERLGPGRRYRFHLAIEGSHDGLVQLFDLDLDASAVRPESQIGSVQSTQGRLTVLRVNRVGTRFGPPADEIDGEAIIQLDTEPGRAFGFQLRAGQDENTQRRMLDLLRDAFNKNTRLRLDYVRTGIKNGRLIRAMRLD